MSLLLSPSSSTPRLSIEIGQNVCLVIGPKIQSPFIDAGHCPGGSKVLCNSDKGQDPHKSMRREWHLALESKHTVNAYKCVELNNRLENRDDERCKC